MRKILVFIVSIALLLGLFGCETPVNPNPTPDPTDTQTTTPTPEYKYSDAAALISEAFAAMTEGIADSFAIGIGIDLQLSGKMGNKELTLNAEGDLKLILDYVTKTNSQYLVNLITEFESNFEIPFEEFAQNEYFAYDEEDEVFYLYQIVPDYEGGYQKIKTQTTFEEIFTDSFEDLMDNLKYILFSELPFDIDTDDEDFPEELTKETLIGFISANNAMDPITKKLLIDLINETITDADLDLESYIDVSVSPSKIIFTFNYEKFKTLLIKFTDAFRVKLNTILILDEAAIESLYEDEEVAKYLNSRLVREIFYEYYNYEIFNAVFTDVDDPKLIELCDLSEYDNLKGPYDSIGEAAWDFYFYEESELYAEWFAENLFDELYAFVESEYGMEEIYGYALSYLKEPLGMMIMIKEFFPTKLDLSVEIGLSAGNISSIGVSIDIETKVPYNGDFMVQQDLSLSLDLTITFEMGIEITPPEDLEDYELEIPEIY